MSSVEGLWCFRTSSLEQPGLMVFGGTVVLETGRVLGGDSVFAFIGEYELEAGTFKARVRSVQWNNAIEVENVFGMRGPGIDYMVELSGVRQGNKITGHLNPEGRQDLKLPIELLFMHGLP